MHLPVRSRAAAVVLALGLALPFTAARAATTDTAGYPGSWLMEYSGARTLGLGGAFVAVADDALGSLWNPAGLQRMNQNQLMFENVRLFDETAVNSFGVAIPGNWLPSFGLSMVMLHSGDFQRTNELNDNLGNFSETETAYTFTMAKAISPRFEIGANFKLVQQSIEDFSAGGFGTDLGAIMDVGPALHLGLMAANLGGPKLQLRSTSEAYPTQFRAGLAYDLFHGRCMIAAQVDHGALTGTRYHAGSEYWLQPGIALRAGVQDSRATGGFSYRFTPRYQLDYGVADHPLGLSHRIGISYQFAGFFASSQADPQVFSPTGEKATTKISLNAHTKYQPDSWTLVVVDKSGSEVRRFGGPGLPPPHVQWDGKDETGMPLADGSYAYHLEVKDKAGRLLSGPTRKVEISTGGPQGTVPVVTTPPSNP